MYYKIKEYWKRAHLKCSTVTWNIDGCCFLFQSLRCQQADSRARPVALNVRSDCRTMKPELHELQSERQLRRHHPSTPHQRFFRNPESAASCFQIVPSTSQTFIHLLRTTSTRLRRKQNTSRKGASRTLTARYAQQDTSYERQRTRREWCQWYKRHRDER
jgi:hypothetical protein